MNVRQKKYKDAYKIIKFICTNNTSKYYRYNKNLKLWSLYVDLETCLNTNNEKIYQIIVLLKNYFLKIKVKMKK